MKLRIGGCEVDEIIRVGKGRVKLGTLSVIEESGDFLAEQRPGEPLHIVLHENLHRGAIDRAGPLDGTMDPAADGHVGAEEDFGFRIADCG